MVSLFTTFRRAGLCDSRPNGALDRLTRIASIALNAPVALVILFDGERPCLESCAGDRAVIASARERSLFVPLFESSSSAPLLIEDARGQSGDPLHAAIRESGLLACASLTLVGSDGHAAGVFAVLDVSPRAWTHGELQVLGDLTAAALAEIEALVERASRASPGDDLLAQALGGRRNRFFQLFDKSPAFMGWTSGADHVLQGVNRAFVELVGDREIIGKPVADALPEIAAHGLVAMLDRVLETGEPFVAEGMRLLLDRIPGAAPEERFANFVYQPLLEVDGSRSGVFCHGVDVTEQVRATAAIRESEQRHRQLLDSLPGIVYHSKSTPPYETIFVNHAVETLGYTRAELLANGVMWRRRIHPDDQARVAQLMHQAHAAGEPLDLQYRVLAKDGTVRWFHDRGTLVLDSPEGEIVWQGILLDITAQRDAELALRASEERNRLTFDEGGIGMAISHVDGRIERANAALCEFLGYPEDQLRRLRYQDVMHPEDAELDAPAARRIAEGAISHYSSEHRYVRSDSSIVWGLLSVAVLKGSDGKPLRRIVQVQDITERKRAEAALRESEALYRTLVETAHEGVWVVDQVGKTTYVNARLCEMLGIAAAELLAKTIFDFMPAEAAFNARTVFARRQRGLADVLEVSFRRGDGSELFALVSTNSLMAADGAFTGALSMITDITERRRAEQAMQESEARYRHVVANVPGMVYQFVYRPHGSKGFTIVSDGAHELLGVAPEAALRDSEAIFGLIHPDHRAGFFDTGLKAVAALRPWRWEGRAVLATGEEKWIQVASRQEKQPDGTIISDGLLIDVTERRNAAERLAESEIRFRLAARATNDVVYDWKISTDEHFWGETLASAFGYNPEDTSPTLEWWATRIHPSEASRVTASLQAALDGGAPGWSEQYRFRRSDDSYATVLDRGFVLRDETGRALRLVGSMIDLTQHRELEEQLRQSQKMEAIGRLAGGVAHDFNNLLTVIKASTSFLGEDLDAVDPRSEDVRQIADAADRAAALTRQLLAFSRKQILDPKVLDLNAVLQNLLPMLTRLIGEDITIETRLASEVGSVMADIGQLEQVIINLAVNARDAMPDGGRILIETAAVSLGDSRSVATAEQEGSVVLAGDYVEITVVDTGTGMSSEVRARVFEPFFTTKEAGKGTGLGLSTVYGIVKQSGGHIALHSEPGVGTTFRLYLPRIAGAAVIPLKHAGTDRPARGAETVLLAEDQDHLRALARRILERHGYSVLESRNGREALALATQYEGQIHLVLTDVVMPEMSGRGLVERLRAVRPHAAVVYMSGYTDDDVLRRGMLEAGSRFIQKPFSRGDLLRVVREVLDERA